MKISSIFESLCMNTLLNAMHTIFIHLQYGNLVFISLCSFMKQKFLNLILGSTTYPREACLGCRGCSTTWYFKHRWGTPVDSQALKIQVLFADLGIPVIACHSGNDDWEMNLITIFHLYVLM